MTLLTHFAEQARYNAWANRRLFAMAGAISDELYRRDVGAYFKSLHGTLNHLLTADRIWMRRLTGFGDHPQTLDAIIFEQLADLAAARTEEDEKVIKFVDGLSAKQLEEYWDYQTLNGSPQRQRRQEILAHLFNHQTHHRGQCHGILSLLGAQPVALDLLIMQREA
jgi:uncharacterized damage-inducible protein DinB